MTDADSNPVRRSRRTRRLAALGVLVNIALAGVKLVAGVVGNSYALIADAIESAADIVGSVVIWSGLSLGAKPADDDHPYGHGKAEALAALAVSGLVFAAGIAIAIEAVREIITPHHLPEPFTLVVLVVSVLVKEVMFRVTYRASQEAGSDAAAVDAWHHRADALTSLAAFIGISIALLGGKGWEPADDYAALVAAAVVLYNAWGLMRRPLGELMDAEPADVIDTARRIAEGVAGVRGIEKCRARTSGSRHYIEMHVQVDPAMLVSDAHAVGGRVRAAVRAGVKSVADVHIHIEPDGHHGGPASGEQA